MDTAQSTTPRARLPAREPRAARRAVDPLRAEVFRRWILGAVAVSVAGGGTVFAFLAFAAPILLTPNETHRLLIRSAATILVFVAIGVPILLRLRRRRFATSTAWLREFRSPTEQERQQTLAAPREAVRVSAAAWGACALAFALLGGLETMPAALYIFGTVAFGGVSTTAVWYLVVEWVMRPIAARALDGESPDRSYGPTIERRLVMAWTVATCVPLLGVATLTIGYLASDDFRAQRTLAAILVLVGIALVVGLFTLVVAVRSITGRVSALRSALARVQAGDFTAQVLVDDASEIGRLQAGFNTMAAGLAERERIRDTFGTYVDRDVADHILGADDGVDGLEVDVTLMFVDVRGFTGFAENLHPVAVLTVLNRLFERIVPLVHRYGGHVDKYAGDGLLAVFGAPRRHDDHADRALAAALLIADAVCDEFDGELSVGVGLNSGPVIAGNVGGAGRLEFSVIGDAVNIAARVESATRQTGDVVLLTDQTRQLLTGAHAERGAFVERPGLILKGKTTPVQIFAPVTE